MFSRSEIEKFIAQDMQTIQSTLDRWNAIIPEKKPAANFRLGLCSRGIAIYNLLLGNKKEALKWFEKAAEYHQRSGGSGYKDEGTNRYFNALPVSILSRQKNLMISCAEKAIKVPLVDYPSFLYHYLQSLANIVLYRDSDALEHIKQLEKLEPTNYSRLRYYKGLGKTCRGIVEKNEDLLKHGLEEILKRHKTLIPRLGPKMDDALVCIPATVLLLLAKDRGMDVWKEIESEYVPKTIFEE